MKNRRYEVLNKASALSAALLIVAGCGSDGQDLYEIPERFIGRWYNHCLESDWAGLVPVEWEQQIVTIKGDGTVSLTITRFDENTCDEEAQIGKESNQEGISLEFLAKKTLEPPEYSFGDYYEVIITDGDSKQKQIFSEVWTYESREFFSWGDTGSPEATFNEQGFPELFLADPGDSFIKS